MIFKMWSTLDMINDVWNVKVLGVIEVLMMGVKVYSVEY